MFLVESGVDPIEQRLLPVHEVVGHLGVAVADDADEPLLVGLGNAVAVLVFVPRFGLGIGTTIRLDGLEEVLQLRCVLVVREAGEGDDKARYPK